MSNYTCNRLVVSAPTPEEVERVFEFIQMTPEEVAPLEAYEAKLHKEMEYMQLPNNRNEPAIPNSRYFDYNRVVPMPPRLRRDPVIEESQPPSGWRWLPYFLFTPLRLWQQRSARLQTEQAHVIERENWKEEHWGASCEPIFSGSYFLRRSQVRQGNALLFFTLFSNPPSKVLGALSRMFPAVNITLEWFDEGEEVGYLTASSGETTSYTFE